MNRELQIIGLVVVKNEEFYIEQVVRNISGFCDRIFICDNGSEDETLAKIQSLANEDPKVEVHSIQDMAESHELVTPYAGTPSWIFAVDGDELYDPSGLQRFRQLLEKGVYDHAFNVYGHCFHCEGIDVEKKQAAGYVTPEAKSCTKLYNFRVIDAWRGCRNERLHGGEVDFKEGWHYGLKFPYMETVSWEDADFRCLHLCFMRRSSLDPAESSYSRPNIVDLKVENQSKVGSAWKNEQYRRGDRLEISAAAFLK